MILPLVVAYVSRAVPLISHIHSLALFGLSSPIISSIWVWVVSQKKAISVPAELPTVWVLGFDQAEYQG